MVVEEKVIKVMKTDGKILEYRAPIKVHEILSEFSGHAISDSLPEIRRLGSDLKLLGGNLYYLVPVPLVAASKNKAEKKRVRFTEPAETQDDGGQIGKVVRVKLVISKQELEKLLQKEGVSVEDMVSLSKIKQSGKADTTAFCGEEDDGVWKPVLESIPELD